MNERTIKIITGTLVVLGIVSFGALYYLSGRNAGTTTSSQIPAQAPAENFFGASEKTPAPISPAQTQTGAPIQTNGISQMAPVQETLRGQMRKLTDAAVASLTISDREKPFVRYIEKGNGHISEMAPDENIPAKISNTTLTGIYDAFWGKNGDYLIARKIGNGGSVQNIYGTIDKTSETNASGESIGKLNAVVLPSNILDIAVSPNKTKVFYLTKNGDQTSGGIADFKASGPSNNILNIFNSPISEWQISWPSANLISLTNKPSYDTEGNTYILPVQNGNKIEKFVGDIVGLTTILSPDGKKSIYSLSSNRGLITQYYDSSEIDGYAILPITTFPEKCVWSKINEDIVYCAVPSILYTGKHPDEWYQGILSFSDDIYLVDLSNLSRRLIASSLDIQSGEEVDVINPVLSADESILAFINKKDSSPWVVKLK